MQTELIQSGGEMFCAQTSDQWGSKLLNGLDLLGNGRMIRTVAMELLCRRSSMYWKIIRTSGYLAFVALHSQLEDFLV